MPAAVLVVGQPGSVGRDWGLASPGRRNPRPSALLVYDMFSAFQIIRGTTRKTTISTMHP
jgi:hypothetical protein